MSRKNQEKLNRALMTAARLVSEVPTCGALFDPFQVNPVEALNRSLYFPVEPYALEVQICRGRKAFTIVGGPSTWICNGFWRLPEEAAARTLIHEALHHAGMEGGRRGTNLSPISVTRVVSRNCRFPTKSGTGSVDTGSHRRAAVETEDHVPGVTPVADLAATPDN